LAQIPHGAGTSTVIALGDLTQPKLHGAATELGALLDGLGTVVRYHHEPSVSLPDKLSKLDSDMHVPLMEKFFKDASEKLPKKSSAVSRRSALMPHVDFALACTTVGSGEDAQRLSDFAARRLETTTRHGFNPDGSETQIFHDVEISFRDAQSNAVTVGVARQVPDEMLSTPRALLNRIPGTSSVLINSLQGTAAALEQAIRGARAEAVIETHAFRQVGWRLLASGNYGYLTATGAVTAVGLDSSHRAMTDHRVQYKLTEAAADARPWEFWPALFETLSADVAMPFVGHLLATWAGMQSVVGNAGALLLAGKPGSGKTTVGSLVGRLVSPQTMQLGDSFATFDSSTAAARNASVGMNDAPIALDDAREELDLSGRASKAAEQMRASWESLIRLAYGGSSAGYAKMSQSANGNWTTQNADPSNPGIVLIAERMVPGGQSTAERVLPVRIDREKVFRGGDVSAFAELVGGDSVDGVLFDFLRWVASERDKHGDGWAAYCKRLRVEARALLPAELVDGFAPRASEIASYPVTGLMLLTNYLGDRRGVALKVSLAAQSAQVIGKLQVEHWRLLQADTVTDWQLIIRALKQAVASRRYYITAPSRDNPNVIYASGSPSFRRIGVDTAEIQLGRLVIPRGESLPYFAFAPGDVLSVVRPNPKFASMTESQLFAAFSEVGLFQPSGRPGKLVRWIAGTSAVVALAIPREIWELGDDELEGTSKTV
jgi:hypothetical protein